MGFVWVASCIFPTHRTNFLRFLAENYKCVPLLQVIYCWQNQLRNVLFLWSQVAMEPLRNSLTQSFARPLTEYTNKPRLLLDSKTLAGLIMLHTWILLPSVIYEHYDLLIPYLTIGSPSERREQWFWCRRERGSPVRTPRQLRRGSRVSHNLYVWCVPRIPSPRRMRNHFIQVVEQLFLFVLLLLHE